MRKILFAIAAVFALASAARAEPPPIASDVLTFERSFTAKACKDRALKTMSNGRFGDAVENDNGAAAAKEHTAAQVRCEPRLKTVIFIVTGRGVGYTALDELRVLVEDFLAVRIADEKLYAAALYLPAGREFLVDELMPLDEAKAIAEADFAERRT